MNKVAKKVLKFSGKILKGAVLGFLDGALDTSKKEYEPTQHEIMCGEKSPFSDTYFVPDEKYHP